MKISKRVKIVLAVIITVVLVWVLSAQVNLLDISGLLKTMPVHLLIVSFVLYVFGHLGRTLRFYRLLDWKNSFHDLFSIVCVHNMFINTLPARTGEVSYFYMTKKRGISLTKGGSILVLARILDMISIAIILLVSVFFAGSLPVFFTKLSYFIAAGLVVCMLLLFSLVYFGQHFLKLVRKVFSFIGFGKSRLVDWIIERGEEIVESFKVLKSWKSFFEHLFYSFFIWSVRFVLFYLITIGLGLDIGVWVCIIGLILPIFSAFLPVQGIGGFGTIEGAWTLSFMALGVSKEAAILTGFGFHIVFLMYTLILGAYGFIVPLILKKLG